MDRAAVTAELDGPGSTSSTYRPTSCRRALADTYLALKAAGPALMPRLRGDGR